MNFNYHKPTGLTEMQVLQRVATEHTPHYRLAVEPF